MAVGLSLLATSTLVSAAIVATADTKLQVDGVKTGIKVVSLGDSHDKAKWAADDPAAMPFVPFAIIGKQTVPLPWRQVTASELPDPAIGHYFVYTCDDPKLELASVWRCVNGPGPIEHELSITNHGTQTVQLPLQASLAFDSIAAPDGHALECWTIEKGAGTPGAVGEHITPVGEGFTQTFDSTSYAPDKGQEMIPWLAIHDPQAKRGWYVGIEFSGRVRIAITRQPRLAGAVLHVEAGLTAEKDYLTELAPGQTLRLPSVFVGCYQGEVDDGCNQLRRWLKSAVCPPVTDPHYPLLTNNSWGSGMAVDERLSRTMIDQSAELGLEMFHVDAGWFRGVGDWFPDAKKFPTGLEPVADYAHAKGLKFGLWVGWTQGGNQRDQTGPDRPLSVFDPQMKDWFPSDVAATWKPADFTGQTVCLADPAAEQWCLDSLRRIITQYKLDMLEHDQRMIVDACRRTDHPHTASRTDVAAQATQAYYRIYDTLRREHADLLLEDCVNGGRMVDFGVIRRANYISITDTYDPLSNRRAFYDASYLLPPAYCECYIANHPGKTLANFVFMLRSGMMGWCTIMTDTSKWTPEQHTAAKRQFALYKSALRPLIRQADLYHLSERPDGVRWDAIEYWDESTGKGAVFAFRGTTPEAEHHFILRGLRADANYKLTSEDGSLSSADFTGASLRHDGITLHLPEP